MQAGSNKPNNFKISIIGAGVVGYASGMGLIKKNHDVTFLDVDAKRIAYLTDLGLKAFTVDSLHNQNTYDVSFLSVSTPTVNGLINLSYLKEACKSLGRRLATETKYHLVVARSTLLPGTTRHLVIKTIENYSGKQAGKDFGVCVNPEYLREATAESDFAKPWVIVIGEYDKQSGDMLEAIYSKFDAPVYRIPLEEAEIQKYIHNLYNAVKIAFFNEFRDICTDLGLDAQRIYGLVAKSCEGMWNAGYGTKDLGPFGGSCLPKDTEAFLSFAKTHGYDTKVLEAAIEANNSLTKLVDTRKYHTK
jgi:UDPglucose 6-dehydrogenase